MNQKMQEKSDTSGFTLLETLLVLGIVGLIAGGIWMGYSSANRIAKNVHEEQQIAAELDMARGYLIQFNENCTQTSLTACPLGTTASTAPYRAGDTRTVITDQFVNKSLVPGNVQTVKNNISSQYSYNLPDDGNSNAFLTEYGVNGIATLPSSGNPYGSGPMIAMGFYGFSMQACIDTVNTWAGSPDRIQKSGLLAVFKTGGWTNGSAIPGLNVLTGTMTSLATNDVQTVCNGGNVLIFIFRLNP